MKNDAYQKGAVDKEKILKEECNKNIETAIKIRLEAKEDEIYNEAYDEGVVDGKAKGSKLSVNCEKCNKPMIFDISEKENKDKISALLMQKYTHIECAR